jgi:hypothetical protein
LRLPYCCYGWSATSVRHRVSPDAEMHGAYDLSKTIKGLLETLHSTLSRRLCNAIQSKVGCHMQLEKLTLR